MSNHTRQARAISVETLSPAEYDELRLIDKEWPKREGRTLPSLHQGSESAGQAAAPQLHLIRSGQKPLCLIHIAPLELIQGEARIEAAAIGMETAPAATQSEEQSAESWEPVIARLTRDQFPISLAWGDRHFFGTAGYELCGRTFALTLQPRGLARAGIQARPVLRYMGEPHLLTAIMGAYNAKKYRRIRTTQESQSLYGDPQLSVLCTGEAGSFGYIVITETDGSYTVSDFGGETATVLSIAKTLMETMAIDCLRFDFPCRAEAPELMMKAASYWKVEPACCLRILDLEKTVEAFQSQCDSGPADIASLYPLNERQQADVLFGFASSSSFKIFVPPIDR